MVAFPKKTRENLYCENPINSGITSVIGADTYIGAHMVKHLRETGKNVYCFSQKDDFKKTLNNYYVFEGKNPPKPSSPLLSDWIIVCIDPVISFESYSAKIRNLCKYLYANKFAGQLVFFSSIDICETDGEPIDEESYVCPCTESDLCLATAEHIINVERYKGRNNYYPYVLRIGDVYGDEIGIKDPPGIANGFVREAESVHNVSCSGMAQRTFTHVSDVCDSAITIMETGYCPEILILPGEKMTIRNAAELVARSYGVPLMDEGLELMNDSFACGEPNPKSKYTLEKWLNKKKKAKA